MHRFNLALAVRRLACRCHGHAGILALLLLALTAAPASAQVRNRSGGGTWANNSTNVSPTYVNGGPATFNNTTGGTIHRQDIDFQYDRVDRDRQPHRHGRAHRP